MKLYRDAYWFSPYSFTAHVALREKGIPFENVELLYDDTGTENPGYRRKSIMGRIPTIEHDGFWLTESAAIVDYLEEAFPAPKHGALLPRSIPDRARARMILGWIRSDLMALREERPTTTIFYTPATKPLSAAGREAADELVRIAELLLPPGKTQLFAEWSIADTDLSFMLQRLLANGHPVPNRIRDFAAAQWARPVVQEFVKHARPPAPTG